MFWQSLLPIAQAADAPLNDSLSLSVKFLIVVGILIGSFAAGVFLSRSFRMPDYGWKIGLVLGSLLLGVAIVVLGWPPKLGIDLSGGVILVYEVDQEKKGDQTIDMNEMVAAIGRRINPGGTKEITIRPYGAEQVEIIIPEVDEDEVRRIEKIITNIGSLEFRIVANQTDHGDDIERARDLPLNRKELRSSDGTPLYRWVEVEHKPATIQYFSNPMFAQRQNAQGNMEVLVKIDRFNVTGSDLAQALPTEADGRPAVQFGMTTRGATKFGALTGANQPDPATGHQRQLGIILDDFLVSAPNLRSTITDQGQITGEFTQEEVNDLVGVLRAGKLPAALEKTPSTRLITGPTLGADTIRQAEIATIAAMFVVVAFMTVYYRLAGVVASFALVINLLLTVAVMILIKAAFTLTGVAGLALTLGMSVDANVLIYERLREELQRGATLRMAIRNGFARAMTTIIDSNLTTLITAVVLYVVGTDQIKGFAVTLTLGLLISLFTSIFCSRVVLDILEKQRWITNLRMMQFVGITNVDFMGKTRIMAMASLLLIAVGLTAVVTRGKNMLDIDFLGGTSIQVLFSEPQDIAEVRQALTSVPRDISTQTRGELEASMGEELQSEARQELGPNATDAQVAEYVNQRLDELSELRDVAVSGVKIPGEADGLRFQFNTSNPNVRAVETLVKDLFAGKLAHNNMSYSTVAMISAEEARKAGATTRSTGTASSSSEESGDADDDSASTPSDSPAEKPAAAPESNQGSSIRPGDERLLALANVGEELALLAQNEQNPTTETPSSTTPAEAEKPAAEAAADTATDQFAQSTVTFSESVNHDTLEAKIKNAMEAAGVTAEFNVTNPQYTEGSNVPYDTWDVRMAVSQQQAEQLLKTIQSELHETPVFPASTNIGGKVAGSTRLSALYALLASMVLVAGYIWARFDKLVFGLAAIVALLHDVLVSMGAVAVSYYIAQWLGPVAAAVQIDPFKIDLTIVAALLTIVGYSLNDTIVVFDRIREVRGKSPNLTKEMLNLSINQTLSRTILTGLTTMFVLIILYIWGGQGIHGFAYCLLVGMVVGTYSSIYVASPVLLWLMTPRGTQQPELATANGGRSPNYARSLEERGRA